MSSWKRSATSDNRASNGAATPTVNSAHFTPYIEPNGDRAAGYTSFRPSETRKTRPNRANREPKRQRIFDRDPS
jgi:hypothetical protein